MPRLEVRKYGDSVESFQAFKEREYENGSSDFRKNIACIYYQGKPVIGESKGHPYWHAEIDAVMRALVRAERINEQRYVDLFRRISPLKPKKEENEETFYLTNRDFLDAKRIRDSMLLQYFYVKTSNNIYTERYPCSNCMDILSRVLGETGEIHYTVSMLGKSQEQVARELQVNYEEFKIRFNSQPAAELPSASLAVSASFFPPLSTATQPESDQPVASPYEK